MSIQPPLSLAEIEQLISFDTLLAQSMADVERLAGRTWTDRAEHDPGVTLLQSLAYAVSDVAYRHSLPLADLLTPEEHDEQPGIFAPGFGPDQVLTCGPVTVDDYRRGLLDLHQVDGPAGGEHFLVRNAELVRETAAEQFNYVYHPESRKFLFVAPEGDAPGYQPLQAAGSYHLYLELNRGVTQADAQGLLEAFLRDHRNLCEQVRTITWLNAQAANVFLVVELEDDCTDPARVMAQLYQAGEARLRGEVLHHGREFLSEQGLDFEDIFQGPRLRHGWITELPPALNYATAEDLSLAPLANDLLAIPGVARVQRMSWHASNDTWILNRAVGRSLLPWGHDPLATLAEGKVVKLFKRGQLLNVTATDIQAALIPTERYDDQPVTVPYGRWRQPARYFWAGQRLPPCYGLHADEPTPEQVQLHQFMLPFEQTLIDACSLLALLPDLLSFQRRADRLVWGEYRWPFDVDTVPDRVHQPYKQAVIDRARDFKTDEGKELALVDYLLGYFGENRADRTLWVSPASTSEFLEVQQAYLGAISSINYNRASLRINEVSALQQRIAARLGFGARLFDDPHNVENLPFYIVEHRALLPISPTPAYDAVQTPTSAVAVGQELTVVNSAKLSLQVGQLVDLLIVTAAGVTDQTISQVMIREVSNTQFKVSTSDNQQFTNAFEKIKTAAAGGLLRWCNGNAWLMDMDYRLAYAPDQPVNVNEKRLTLSPYPLDIANGDVILLEMRDGVFAPQDSKRGARAVTRATVVMVEPLLGTMVIQTDDSLPADNTVASWRWRIERRVIRDHFSFVVSVVFPRDLLVDASERELKAAWFQEVVRAEVPAHIEVHLHWLSTDEYEQFADDYRFWQNDGLALGDRAYALLEALSIGRYPAGNNGIGARRIATDEQAGMAWDAVYINEHELFYVPREVAQEPIL